MNKNEINLEVKANVKNLTEVEVRQLAEKQSKENIEMDGYLHKLYEEKNGKCDWYSILDIQCVDDLSLEKSLKLEERIRKQLIKSNIKDSEYRDKMIKALAYKGRLYRLYITYSENSKELLLIQWFNLIGLCTYGYYEMNWNYYTTEEVEKFYLDTTKKVLEMDIKTEIQKKEHNQEWISSQMVDETLVTLSCSQCANTDVYHTYVSRIVNDDIDKNKNAGYNVKTVCNCCGLESAS